MNVSRRTLARVISDSMHGGGRLTPMAIAAYVLQTHRASDLASLLRDVRASRAASGYVEIVADSVYPLAAAVRGDIEREARSLYPTAKTVTVTERRRPELLAGVKLDMIDYQLDVSARRALQRFSSAALAGKDI